MAEPNVDAVSDGVEELNLGAKKRRRAPIVVEEIIEDEVPSLDIELVSAQNLIAYDEALTLVFQLIKDNNTYFADDKKKFTIRPPVVGRAGSKKTAFSNFLEVCRDMKRQDKHVLQFLLAELGTTGSIDGSNCLIVKGRWQQKHFESVIRKYIKEYVNCHTCKSHETQLTKDTRVFFLQCHNCGSRCSVTAIKNGFQAVVGRHADIRRANEAAAGQ